MSVLAPTVREAAFARAVPTLAGTQVLGGVGVASGIAVGGILAQDLSGSAAYAGLAQTMSVVGGAALALPLAGLAQRSGRRVALAVGYLAGAAGAVAVLLGAALSSFPLLLVGMAGFGGATASGLQARYAATDAAPPRRRGRALSTVVWATTVGAVAGPNLTGPGEAIAEPLGLAPTAGPFVISLVAFGVAATALLVLLRPDPLVASRAAAPADGATAGTPARAVPLRRAVAGIRGPRALLGLLSVALGHAVMVGVMVMTPVHLHDHGATLHVVGLVISAHIAGMYALSPVFGALSDRLGREAAVVVGLVVLAVALLLAGTAAPTSHVRLAVALTLLGVGWSACLVGGSTLLSETVADDVRTGVQGVSDLVMGVVAALAGAAAGPLLAAWGYPSLNAAAAVLLLPVAALLVLSRYSSEAAGSAGGGDGSAAA